MISRDEIKIYKSSNTDSDGGDISANEVQEGVLNNLFPDVLGDDTVLGAVLYRKIFIKNESPDTVLQLPQIWVSQDTDSPDDEIYIATSVNLTGANPTGEGQDYVHPDSIGHPDVLTLGNLSPDEYAVIWIKRVVDAKAEAYTNNSFELEVQGNYTLS